MTDTKRVSRYTLDAGYHGYTLRTRLVRERRTFMRARFSDAKGVSEFLDDLRNSDRERVLALPITVKNEVIGVAEVSVGTVDASLVQPSQVFKPALLANAGGVIVAHNHPSGDPEPSPQDLDVTRRLIDAGVMLGVPLIDHIVLGEGTSYVSLAERGHV